MKKEMVFKDYRKGAENNDIQKRFLLVEVVP